MRRYATWGVIGLWLLAMRTIERRRAARSVWAGRLKLRRGTNVAVVALANKNARLLWAFLTSGERYQPAPFSGRVPQVD